MPGAGQIKNLGVSGEQRLAWSLCALELGSQHEHASEDLAQVMGAEANVPLTVPLRVRIPSVLERFL